LLYQSGAEFGFLANTTAGWKPDTRHAPPLDLSKPLWVLDIDCSGTPALMGVVNDPVSGPAWKIFKFASTGWRLVSAPKFQPPFAAGTNPEAIRTATFDDSKCPGIIVATAEGGGLHAAFQASPSGWVTKPTLVPPFDFVDSHNLSTAALVANVT